MVIGIAGIVAMGLDKLLAVIGRDRISEKTLHIIALLGGFWGIIIGAFLFHYKTSKREFWPPVLFAAALWDGSILRACVRLHPPSRGFLKAGPRSKGLRGKVIPEGVRR